MVARRVKKGPQRVRKGSLSIPARIELEPSGKVLDVHIFRTDRDTPHSIAISFHIDRKTVDSKEMCIVVYNTLRGSMRELMSSSDLSQAGCGKRRSKPSRIPGK